MEIRRSRLTVSPATYETGRGRDVAPRRMVGYACPKGHVFEVPFSHDAELPSEWECRRHGEVSEMSGCWQHPRETVKPRRMHWDMLLERRTIPELEQLLAERLAEIAESSE